MQIGILAPECLVVGFLGIFEGKERAHPPHLAIAVNVHAPSSRPSVVADPLNATFAVAAGVLVMLACLLLGDQAQVFAAAIKPIAVAEDHFVFWRYGPHDFAVEVNGVVLFAVLVVAYGVTLAAVSLATIAPVVRRDMGEIVVIDKRDLTLREWNVLHGSNLRVAVFAASCGTLFGMFK